MNAINICQVAIATIARIGNLDGEEAGLPILKKSPSRGIDRQGGQGNISVADSSICGRVQGRESADAISLFAIA
ncbi:MAG: hypothetical protein ACRC8Y_22730 [Chroococcales cyanobacterium]